MGQSVRELKEALSARGVDFSHVFEKDELEQLLKDNEGGELSPDAFPDGGFARHGPSDRICWVDFVDDGDALCHLGDGSDAILPAAEFAPMMESELPGPRAFAGSFEEARAEAFRAGRLLVVDVRVGPAAGSKAERMQTLAFATSDVAELVEENAVFWRGQGSGLRPPHLQQLAPKGTPSLAAVLPLAADAMRVLAHPEPTSDALVAAFVDALEALEAHRDAVSARMVSEDAQLRMAQDREFEQALEADRLAEALRASADAAEIESRREDGCGGAEDTKLQDVEGDAVKRPADEHAVQDQGERIAKVRRTLADKFLSEASVVEGAGAARIVLRLPSGERVQRNFGAEEPFSRVLRWAECCALLPEANGRPLQIPERFELCIAFPRRRLSAEEGDRTLRELELVPSAALLLFDGCS